MPPVPCRLGALHNRQISPLTQEECHLSLDTKTLALDIAKAAEERRALDVVVLDMREVMGLTDYFVICHGRSRLHVQAVADAVEDAIEKRGNRVTHREGRREGRWVLLDYLSVVVHVFTEDARDFYDLERLWGDAPVVYAAEAQDVVGFLEE